MNTVIARGNAVFAFAFSALTVVALGCFLSTAFYKYRTEVDVRIEKVALRLAREVNDPVDLAFLKFGLSVDFSPLFNWNTKMLFIYLLAEYQTSNNAMNQVVIWDKIMMRGDDPKIAIDHSNTKYYMFDDGKGFRNHPNVTFQLQWNVIPNIGMLPRIGGGDQSISFPERYAG